MYPPRACPPPLYPPRACPPPLYSPRVVPPPLYPPRTVPPTFSATHSWQNKMQGVRPFYSGPSRNLPMGLQGGGGMNMGAWVNTPWMPNQRPSIQNPPILPAQLQVPPTQQDVATDNLPSLRSLTQSTPQEPKQIIGEHLHREIYSMHADIAGKITGKV